MKAHLALTAAIALLVACGDAKPPYEEGANNPAMYGASAVSCGDDGSETPCAIELGRFDGVVSCAKGKKTCSAGAWSTCVVPTSAAIRFTVPEPDAQTPTSAQAGVRSQSISSTPQNCTDNPCDPYCQHFPDAPDAAVRGDVTVNYPDRNPTLNEVPSADPTDGFITKGTDSDNVCAGCGTGNTSLACRQACQFDAHCKGGQNGCSSYAAGEHGSCSGVDITAPLVCEIPSGAPANAGKRKLEICNRGTTDIAANSGVVCWSFPSGSPPYPSSDPVSRASASAGPIDTFNEAIAAGACVTHVVDAALFGTAGTTSVMCNVRQLVSSVQSAPSAGSLPANARTAGSSTDTGWTNPAGARDVGGTNATMTFLQSTTGKIAPRTASTSSWINTAAIGTSADGASATVEVGSSHSKTASATSIAVLSDSFTNLASGRVIDGASASAIISGIPIGPLPAFSTQAIAPATWSAGLTNVNNATGFANGVVASQSIAPGGSAAIWAGYSAISIAAGTTLLAAQVTVHWKGASNKLSGHAELWTGSGASLVKAASSVTAPTTGLTDTTFTFTQGDLLNLSIPSLVSGKLVKFVVDNSSTTTAYQADIDSISFSITYTLFGAIAKVRLTNFGFNLPSNAIVTGLTVTGRGATSGLGTTVFTVDAYKAGRSTLVGSASLDRTNTTALTDISFSTNTGLSPGDLSDANFAVDITAISYALLGMNALVDGATVTVTYDVPNSQTVTLDGFDIASAVPSGAMIDGVKLSAGWATDVTNNRASFSAVAKLAGTPLLTLSDGAPSSAIPAAGVAASWNAGGASYPASSFSNGNFVVDLTAATTGSGFIARVDWLTVEVTYSWPASPSSIVLRDYGLNVPAGAASVQITFQARWSASDPTTQLCLDGSEGTHACSTASATPTTLSTFTVTGAPTTAAAANAVTATVSAYHRPGSGPSTVTLDYVVVQATYTTSRFDTGVDECNVDNNWTVSKKTPPLYCPTTSTYFDFYTTRVFNGVCPTGSRPRWRLFGWDSSTPHDTKIEFRFHTFEPTVVRGVATCPARTAAFTGSPTPVAVAKSSPTDTQTCSLTTAPTATCPTILTDYLTKPPAPIPNSDSQCLQLDAHGYADALGTPELRSWNVTYDCLPTD